MKSQFYFIGLLLLSWLKIGDLEIGHISTIDQEYYLNDGQHIQASLSAPEQILNFTGPWKVKFPSGWGAPDSSYFNQLLSWTDSKTEGIK